MDDPGRDDEFDLGALDVFTDNMIGDCKGFKCDWNSDIELKPKLIHQGNDEWRCEYVRYCNIGILLFRLKFIINHFKPIFLGLNSRMEPHTPQISMHI